MMSEKSFMGRALLCAMAVLLGLATLVPAATLHLKDGTVVEGDVKKLGNSYSVKTKDGALKLISASDVASIDDPTGKLTVGASKPGAPAGGGASSAGPDFLATKRSAERVDSPIIAVTLWQKYIEDHPNDPNLAEAQAELDRWQAMATEGAEKIRGKWVGGQELKDLHQKVSKLLEEWADLSARRQTLPAIEKLQEIIRIYPNCFEAHFELGYYSLVKGGNEEYDKAIASLETAARLKPNSAAAHTNLAIAYNFRRKYEQACVSAFKAVEIDGSRVYIQNLVNALSYAPPGMRTNNPKVRPIVDQAKVLMADNGIPGPSGQWIYMRREMPTAPGESEEPPLAGRNGIVGSGTGFFITADGYIMTNRHVAAVGDKLIVRLSDGTQKVADVVLLDDKQDIAILRIKTDKEVPFIRLASYDQPPIGTDVTVMGFPLGAMLGTNVKITRGVVTSYETSGPDCDVIVDAQVNPGNSGGPMVDKYGNLLALVAMKTFADASVSSYGLGISTGRLRKFFETHKGKLEFALPEAEKNTAALSTEEIAGKYTKATVMIMMVAGELPEGLK